MIKIFTDGSSRGNPGPGGWGAIIAFLQKSNKNNEVVELGGREGKTTNNRMELSAVIESLDFVLKAKSGKQKSIIYTDSSYVKKGATEWLSSWQERGWKTASKKDVLNKDLWERLASLLEKIETEFKLLPGHSNIPGNERCDEIATMFADGESPNLYSGSLESYGVDLNIVSGEKISSNKSKSSNKKAYSYLSLVKGVVMTHSNWKDCEARVKGVSGAKYKKALSLEEEREIISKWQKNS